MLGTPNLWTIGIMLMSLLIPLGALGKVMAVWRHRRAPMNRVGYWHAVLVTLGLIFFAGFLFSWGPMGMRMKRTAPPKDLWNPRDLHNRWRVMQGRAEGVMSQLSTLLGRRG